MTAVRILLCRISPIYIIKYLFAAVIAFSSSAGAGQDVKAFDSDDKEQGLHHFVRCQGKAAGRSRALFGLVRHRSSCLPF